MDYEDKAKISSLLEIRAKFAEITKNIFLQISKVTYRCHVRCYIMLMILLASTKYYLSFRRRNLC